MIRPVSFRLPADLIESIDTARGDVARTRWVQRALEQALVTPEVEPPAITRAFGPNRPVAQRIEGQTTVDEMLASCPQCAGELQTVHDLRIDGETDRCMDCGWIREPAG